MNAAIGGLPGHGSHEASQDGYASLFEDTEASQIAGSFQVPDSDNDESLEELANQQEQEYWSMLGIEDAPIASCTSPHYASTPLFTSKRARSKSLLVYDSSLAQSPTTSPLPSLSHVGRLRSHSRSSAQGDQTVASPSVHWSASMSPDPMSLPNRKRTLSDQAINYARCNLVRDEGYQTRTDSDHVTSLGHVSVEPEDAFAEEAMLQELRNRLTPPYSLGAPSPSHAEPDCNQKKVDDRFLSSPLSIPVSSPEAHAEDVVESTSLGPAATRLRESEGHSEQIDPENPETLTLQDDAAPVRQFRQRKAVQLAPYSTEFSKFARLANKNSWQGIISAGLRQAFLEKEREKAESQKRQRHPSDEWLVHGNDEEEEQESDFCEPMSEPTSPGRKRRFTPASEADKIRHPTKSVEKYSRSRTEKDWDPIAARQRAAKKSLETSTQSSHQKVGSFYASSSKTTIEDMEKQAAKRAKRKEDGQSSHKRRPKASKETLALDHAARAAQVTQARQAGLLPSDVDSSSAENEEEGRSAHKTQSSTQRKLSRKPPTNAESTLAGTSDSSQSDSDGSPGSDGSDRPIATRKERFTLKGKRKRAAMFMMPAVALKKAEADLRLMEREMTEGKQIRLEEERNAEEPDGAVPESVKAKKRWRPQNANRPFRYVTELSTDDSDGESDGDANKANDEDEAQAALHAWTSMATGRHQSATESSKQDRGYWDKVIGRILVRKEQNTEAASKRRHRKTRTTGGPSSANRLPSNHNRKEGYKSTTKPAQSNLRQHFTTPVYLDTGDRLFESCRARHAATRARPRSRAHKDAFWKALAAPSTMVSQSTVLGTASHREPPTIAPTTLDIVEGAEGCIKFARFSFDYDIERIPTEISFAPSSYLGNGHLHELVCHLTNQPTFSPHTPVTPFGIGLDSSMPSEVLLQIVPRLLDCVYEYTLGENVPSNLNGPVNQALRFLTYYTLIYSIHDSACLATRAAIFDQLAALGVRLDKYMIEIDSEDRALSCSMVAFKWAMLEMTILAYAEVHRNAGAAAKEAARHHIRESTADLVKSLLQAGPAAIAKKLSSLRHDQHSSDVQSFLEDLHCEAWVCLINICTVSQSSEGCDFLSLASFWHTLEHRLNEEAIERSMHPIVRGEAASFVAMTMCALSQFNTGGVSTGEPQLTAYWPILAQVLENVKTQEFAQAYDTMSSCNRTRISRYIWTTFARCLTMASRWNWPMLDQGKIVGKLFDILDTRQLQDFSIDGVADFPCFLSNFNGNIPTQIDRDDTAFHIFLRILSQVAHECSQRNDKKAKLALARITMRIMPMREHLPYPRHSTAGKALDRSVLVNHCALLVVLAVIDPPTSERRLAKLKTILDFVQSDSRARQDYLKAIMFMGIVYKVRGIDLTPVLSWLTLTADYLCQTYSHCAKHRAGLLVARRKAALTPKNAQQHLSRPVGSLGSTALSDVVLGKELQDVNKEMGETAIMEGLLLGAVQQIMLTAPEADPSNSAKYPSLEYLDKSWITQVLCSPMARDPVAGSQVMQCLSKFLALRNEHLRQHSPITQGESQDEFGDMDFDYDDPALNAMLGIPEVETSANAAANKELDPLQLDRQFVEIVKTSISPRLYAILSDLNAINSGQETGVPEFQNKEAYADNLAEVWASCAVVLVQKNQRDWKYYMDPFGKESWQRFADGLQRLETGCVFSCVMLGSDSKAYKPNRNTLIQIVFRRLAAPVPSGRDAQLFTHLLNADPSFILWQSLPFEVDELVNEYAVGAVDLTASRSAVLRSIFATCKRIFAREIVTHQGLERSSAAVCREQQVNELLLYTWLGYFLSSLRDFLDAAKTKISASGSSKDYAAFCRHVVFLLKEEMGPAFVTENNLPSLRLLAGVINGTID